MPVLTEKLNPAKNDTCGDNDSTILSRRKFLQAGLATALLAAAPAEAAMLRPSPLLRGAARAVSLRNIHTGESFHGVYWQAGRYLPDTFAGLKTFLRDYRTGEKFPIDPRLMDILYLLQHRLENHGPYEVFSGYRSQSTNTRLRHQRHGAALHSLHMTGQACDVRLPGTRLGALHAAALRARLGGVGYYPVSGFVHVDTGDIRRWSGV